MVVLLVCLEMIGEFVDPLAKQRNLDWRRTRICFMCPKVGHNFFFCFSC